MSDRGSSIARPDVLIVGAGPAGSTLGALLARAGWDVVMIDRARFPRPKPCGECVNPGAVSALRRLGMLGPVAAARPARLSGWELRTSEGRTAGGWFDDRTGPALGIPRARFDDLLLRRAIRDGVEMHEGMRAKEVGWDGPGRPFVTGVSVGCVRRWSPRLLVGADGLRSVVARRLGMVRRTPSLSKASVTCHLEGTGPPRDRGSLTVDRGIVIGLAPIDADRPLWNGTVVVDPTLFGGDLSRNARRLVKGAVAGAASWTAGPEIVSGPWASGPFDWSMRRIAGDGVVLVGDAAGYYDPFTGQGIYRALRSAELAAPAVDRRLAERKGGGEEALAEYEVALRREFRGGRGLQRLIEGVLSRSLTRETAVTALGLLPGGLDALIHVTGDARAVRSLARASSWRRVGGARS